MKNRGLRRVHLFFSSLFICLLHIPFVFAKTKPRFNASSGSNRQAIVTDTTARLDSPVVVKDDYTYSDVYDSLKLASLGLARQVFDYAVKGFQYLQQTGKLGQTSIISIADFTRSSCKKRLWVIDLGHYKLLFNTYVAHGMNSGLEYAKQFSNVPESNKSSLGFYITSGTYMGKNGYSMHLQGVERGINDNAYRRDIVMHGADYVSESMINNNGYLGRSQGCPAVPEKLHKQIIDKIKNGTCLFIFGNDPDYLRKTALLKNTMPLLAVH